MKPSLKELFIASFEYNDYNPLQTKILLLNAMFFISIIINVIFMFLNLFVVHGYTLFFINLFMATLMGLALYLLRKKQMHVAASYIGNVTLFIAFLALALMKHGENYTLVWTYFFTPFAIITLGAKRGLMVAFTFVIILLAVTFNGVNVWDNGDWNGETFLRFSLAHFVMLYVLYALQNSNESANEKIEKLRQKERLQMKLLEKLSITDTLTSLYNRRFFEEIFPRQLQKAQSNKEFLTFFILDLDYFKQYNDTYGHQMGDRALKQGAESLEEVFDKSDDYLFRMGGEEFAGIILDENIANIHALINSVMEKLHEKQIEHRGNPDADLLTCSIGVYIQAPEDGLTHQEIYRLADESLYKAKRNGRDQIVFA